MMLKNNTGDVYDAEENGRSRCAAGYVGGIGRAFNSCRQLGARPQAPSAAVIEQDAVLSG